MRRRQRADRHNSHVPPAIPAAARIVESPGRWVAGAFILRLTPHHGRGMEPQGPTLLDWLIQKYPLAKRQTFKRMLEAGRVRINGRRPATLRQPVGPTDQVEVLDHPPASSRTVEPPPPFGIVFEDDDLIVVNKPAGMLTSTVPRERRPTLLAAVREHVARRGPRARVGLIHRLDRDASGLLVFSKNDAAYRSLKTQFFHHTVTREYLAVVHGAPDPKAGRIENWLVERADGIVCATRQGGRGERAVSQYEVLQATAKRSLVRVTLETGRKHQIRVHLAGRGTPIVGDTVYGPDRPAAPRLMLEATRLVIQHPRSGERAEFALAPSPEFLS